MSLARIMLRRLLLVGLATAGIWLLLLIPGLRPRDFVADRWRDELATTADDELESRLRAIVALAGDEFDVLVHSLAADRPVQVQASAVILNEQIEQWRKLPAAESTPRVAELAETLAANIHKFDLRGKLIARSLARQMLHWPVDDERKLPNSWIADCETVLRSSTPRPNSAAFSDVTPRSSPDRQPPRQNAAEFTPRNFEVGDSGLGSPPTALPADAPAQQPPSAKAESIGPRLFTPLPANNADISATQIERSRPSIAFESVVANLSDMDVMRYLHDSVVAKAAELELRQRGFQPRHLQLARRLTDPDTRVRRELAEELPRLAGVQPRQWLIELSHDPDAGVRRAAATVMATSQDPEIQARLDEMLLRDPDPEIRQIASRNHGNATR